MWTWSKASGRKGRQAQQDTKQLNADSWNGETGARPDGQLLERFVNQAPLLAMAGLLLALILTGYLLLRPPDPRLFGLLAVIMSLHGLLWFASHACQRQTRRQRGLPWPHLFRIILSLMGLAWGSLLFWVPNEFRTDGILLLLVLLALAAPITDNLRYGISMLGLPALLPILVYNQFTTAGSPLLGAILLIVMIGILVADRVLHGRLRTQLKLEESKRLLESQLRAKNRELMKLDLRLQREIGSRQQAEERFLRFSEAASEGVIIHDKGVIIDVNDCIIEMTGRGVEDLMGTSWLALVSEELRPQVKDHLESLSDSALRTELIDQQARPLPVLLQNKELPVGEMTLQVVIIKDMTRQIETENALLQEKERAMVTLESIGDSVVTTDADGLINYINPVCEHLTGWRKQDAVGRYLADIMRLVDRSTKQVLTDPVTSCLVSEKQITLNGEITLQGTRSEREYSIESMITPLRDRDGGLIGAVLVFHDVTLLRAMAEQMSHQATHDALTGLVNRQEFERRLIRLIESGKGSAQQHAMCYLDLDEFKVVNDTSGHAAGDRLLKEITAQLQKCIRDTDTLARLGGDEFGALLVGCPLSKAEEIAHQMRETVKSYRLSWEDRIYEVGVSIGLVPVNAGIENVTDILRAADSACYVAKDHGRNRVHVYQENDAELARHHTTMHWMQKIQRALEHGHFRLYYQPIRDAALCNDHVWHAELLIRMLDKQDEVISPGNFIPAAERYHLMGNIDRWVIMHAFEQFPLLQQKLAAKKIVCAINLSGQSLSDNDFLAFLIDKIDHSGIEPGSLCFEITETAVISNIEHAQRLITILRGMGCLFALDDFGSGLSSFSYLKCLPVDYLKIDGSFVRNMLEDETDFAMVRSIQQIGTVMGIRTIAEFVETPAIAQALNEIGVDFVQGYGVGRPAPLAELMAGSLASDNESPADHLKEA